MSRSDAQVPAGSIAVIGMACRFPGANSVGDFWRNLRSGVESITFFTPEQLKAAGVAPQMIGRPGFVGAKGVLDQADCFDAGFFGYSPREAALMDPQQRIFVECAWTALEDAGYDPRTYQGAIGVFAGSILSTYLLQNLWPNRDLISSAGTFQTAIGNDPTFLATKVSYLLDLCGPSISVGSACSTSLVAVHLACQSLLAHESDIALAGGISVHLPLVCGYTYQDGGILSPDGHCRPFDAAARGTVSSDGAGIVVLKRAEEAIADRDFIHALIRGSAVNNDGSEKVGYTAPSVGAQARIIKETLAVAGVDPETIGLVEAHAAGTPLGDPIEVAALAEVFSRRDGARELCALGSVKSNIGHVDAAAGVAGLIKAVLAVRHREIPPTLHFEQANPQIDFASTPFYVNTKLRCQHTGAHPMRAAVSSFGIGGTNAHVIVEEPPKSPPLHAAPLRPFEMLPISARTATALEAASDRLADHLERNADIDFANVGHTLRCGRRAFEHRRFLVCRDRGEAITLLRSRDPKRVSTSTAPAGRQAIAFMFPGLGDHYPRMGWELYCIEKEFRDAIDRCAEFLHQHLGAEIRDSLYPDRDWANPVLDIAPDHFEGAAFNLRAMVRGARGAEQDTAASDLPAIAQPAIFATEVALVHLLRSWGVEPDAMVGYSIGEFTAAYVSGVLSLPDALELVAARARLIQSRVKPGAMLAVPLGEAELQSMLPSGVSLSAVNGRALAVAAGEPAAVAELETRLGQLGISSQRLRSTHAYHSTMMEPIVEPLLDVLRRIELKPPQIPYISCVTGTWIADDEATSPQYWADHLCRTVRFHGGLSELRADRDRVLIEVGPGQTLTSHAIAESTRIRARNSPAIPTMRASYARQSEFAALLRAVGQMWLAGAPVDLSRISADEERHRVPLPTYPFERQRYWIDPPADGRSAAESEPARKRPAVQDWFYLPHWKPSVVAPCRAADDGKGAWLVFADRLGIGAQIADRLRKEGQRVALVTPGEGFRRRDDTFTIEISCGEDYRRVIRQFTEGAQAPRRILHLWSLTSVGHSAPSSARFAAMQAVGYQSLVHVLQALGAEGLTNGVRVDIVANQLFNVDGRGDAVPEKATLLAPAMVGPQEHPGLTCRCIEIDTAAEHRGDDLIARVVAELRSDSADGVVAYRGAQRFVQAFEPVELEAPDSGNSPFRQRGVYLLTGGLGGIGLVMARHLAQAVQARLVLVGRSAFPPRAQWPRWLSEHDDDDRTALRIRQLLALEELGSEILIQNADVSDLDAVRQVLAATDDRFGELHGVIHGAGAIGIEAFREIKQTTAADAERQFAAKVHGLMNLEHALGDRPLDFCILMSSLAAILGGLGFTAYSAGNLFMDAFAGWKNCSGGRRWTSIDWDSWRLSDVTPVIAGLGKTVSEFIMAPEEGASACERIIAQSGLNQVIVSTGDLQARRRQWVSRDTRTETQPSAMPVHQRPHLNTPYEAPRSQLEASLAEIWQDLFHIQPIGLHDNFFELGGHSLLATQLNARLASKFQVEMTLAALLQAPTIEELALAIVNAQAIKTDPDTLARMLAEVGDLSGSSVDENDAGEIRTAAMAVGDE